jgi:hypothetical protein
VRNTLKSPRDVVPVRLSEAERGGSGGRRRREIFPFSSYVRWAALEAASDQLLRESPRPKPVVPEPGPREIVLLDEQRAGAPPGCSGRKVWKQPAQTLSTGLALALTVSCVISPRFALSQARQMLSGQRPSTNPERKRRRVGPRRRRSSIRRSGHVTNLCESMSGRPRRLSPQQTGIF